MVGADGGKQVDLCFEYEETKVCDSSAGISQRASPHIYDFVDIKAVELSQLQHRPSSTVAVFIRYVEGLNISK